MGITSNIMSLAGIAISIGVLVDGAIVEVENAYKRLERWQRGGRQGRLPRGAPARRCKEVGPVGLLLAARDRGGLPADLHAGRPGGPALQAAGLDEEPGHGHRRPARHHARSGAAHAVHAHGLVRLPAALARRGRGTRSRSAATTPRSATRSAACSSRSTSRPAASCCGIPRRRSRGRRCWSSLTTVPVYLAPRAPSSCRRSTRGRILYMPTTLPGHLGDGGAALAAGAGPDPQRSPRSCACSARPAAPRPRPIRRRSRWWRRSCILKPPIGVAAEGRAGTRTGRPSGSRRCAAPHLAGPHLATRSWSTRWTRRCASPA